MITNIPAPRVPFLDAKTGLISREWYQFLLNLFVLTGAGSDDTTVQDVMTQPVVDILDPATVDQAQLAATQARYEQLLDGLTSGPPPSPPPDMDPLLPVAPPRIESDWLPPIVMPVVDFNDLLPVVQVGTLGLQDAENVTIGNLSLHGVLSLSKGTVLLPSTYWYDNKTTGFYWIGTDNIGFSVAATKVIDISSTKVGFSKPVALPAGTVTVPGLYWSTDTTTGIYRPSANNLGIAIGGSLMMRFSSSGQLINCNTASSGAFSSVGALTLTNQNSTNGNQTSIQFHDANDYGVAEVSAVINNHTTHNADLALTSSGGVVLTLQANTDAVFAHNVDARFFRGQYLQATVAGGLFSSDGSGGYTGTVTTATLVGKTITIKDGLITAFA